MWNALSEEDNLVVGPEAAYQNKTLQLSFYSIIVCVQSTVEVTSNGINTGGTIS